VHPVIAARCMSRARGTSRSDGAYKPPGAVVRNHGGLPQPHQDLVSTAYLDGFYYKPRVDLEPAGAAFQGADRAFGVPERPHRETILSDQYDEAKRLAFTYADIFGKSNYFLESPGPSPGSGQAANPAGEPAFAGDRSSLVVTNDSHYLRRDDARAHEILLCIQDRQMMKRPERMRWNTPDFYLKTRDEMMELFGELETRSTAPGRSPSAATSRSNKSRSHSPSSSAPNSTPPTLISNMSPGRGSRSAGRDSKRCAPRAY